VLSIPAEEFAAIKGLPFDWTAEFIRGEALRLVDLADGYVMRASSDLVGLLAVDKQGVPTEVSDGSRTDLVLRKATDEPEVMPMPPDFNTIGWSRDRS